MPGKPREPGGGSFQHLRFVVWSTLPYLSPSLCFSLCLYIAYVFFSSFSLSFSLVIFLSVLLCPCLSLSLIPQFSRCAACSYLFHAQVNAFLKRASPFSSSTTEVSSKRSLIEHELLSSDKYNHHQQQRQLQRQRPQQPQQPQQQQ